MIRISDYIETAFNAMKTVVDKVYLDRPASVSDKVSTYAVVSCQSGIENNELNPDGVLDFYTTTISIDIFVKDKVTSQKTNQMNIKKFDELTKSTFSLFPIINKEKNIMIHLPRIVYNGTDGTGWHYSLITARLTTYINN